MLMYAIVPVVDECLFLSRQDRIYLLQSRPVTSLAGWSEQELTHEHDAALLTDHECITGANTG